ncbi:uncharacterized protein EI97DRAFT_453821 [Westerdykella ornata]|uniref:Uncharacterized protein n=1 Tax=Westerdykella ornata TaxID=318751 RepID=A0A6A6JWV2_WESOR|nr:uncharacterized protein EI97DRAFT_453821 [Westerdykella ornata]KAF2280553.1 hypothetical protein EI97DRAFT_453821 [Westerdykella ornata]
MGSIPRAVKAQEKWPQLAEQQPGALASGDNTKKWPRLAEQQPGILVSGDNNTKPAKSIRQ